MTITDQKPKNSCSNADSATGKSAHRILSEGESCWRLAQAKRATVLIDSADYYEALRACLLKARRAVFIVGWDIDSRTPLVGTSGKVDDELPVQLGPFLTALTARRPALRIHILLWDYSMVYAFDREPLPSINLAWKTPEQISVCLDDVLPIGACHHQKIVVVDDAVAFCGGIDLTVGRWDTAAHNEDRKCVDPAGDTHRRFHDIQMVVDGAAALAIGELVRRRWRDAACENPIVPAPVGDPWPDNLVAGLTDLPVGIARTSPAYDGNAEVREVEALYKRSIETAEKSIYIEAQYLTADNIAQCLARRMQEKQDLEVVIVGPNVHYSWLEEQSMNRGRWRFMNCLKDAGVLDRVRLLYPALPEDAAGEGLMVHSKFMIVDDRLLRVGSANLNNRSLGMDTECDLALEACEKRHSEKIRNVRNQLLAEHLGAEPETVNAAIEREGSLIAAVESLSSGQRSLRPIKLNDFSEDELARTVGQFADPERPIETPSFVGDLFGGKVESQSLKRVVRLLTLAIIILGLVAIWRLTPLAEATEPGKLVQWVQRLGNDLWMPLFIPGIFVLAGLVAFPVTVLIAVMGMMFSPLTAFAYGLAGSMLSAGAVFFIGHLVGRGPLRTLIGPGVNRVSRALARHGIISVAALRMVPIAPFSLINLVAGASHIPTIDFLLGTLLGMAPGILVLSFLGHQLGEALNDPTATEMLLFGLGVIGWLALCLGLQYVAGKLRSRRHG